jgi:hypothetical protein
MTGPKFAIATLAGAVVSLVGGFLIYGLALNSFMADNTMAGMMRDPPEWFHLTLGQVAYGALFTVVIGQWAKVGGAAAGLKIGTVLGLLMCLAFDLTMFATSHVMNNFRVLAVDVVGSTAIAALTGVAVGAALGRRP